MQQRDIAQRGLELLDLPTRGAAEIIIHTQLEQLKATIHTKLIKFIENLKIQLERILCNKKEAALRASMKTMVPTDLQVNLESNEAGTHALPRWSAPKKLGETKIIYKKKLMIVEETKLFKETIIV